MTIQRNATRPVPIGNIVVGDNNPIAAQSMTATKTQNIDATVQQANALMAAGAGVVRIAVDSEKDAAALAEIRKQTTANLAVDLQENFRLAEIVAPSVNKIRYNPGHLYHHQKDKSWQDKVQFIIQQAKDHDCAVRIGVNCGSVDPDKKAKYDPSDSITPMLESALEHCDFRRQSRVQPLRGVIKRQRPKQGRGSQSAVCGTPARRAAASGGHGSGHAPGRYHQDAYRI